MQKICKNCKNFFNHKENYTRQGFCRRFNQVQFRDEENVNCFIPTKDVENKFRNIKKANDLGIALNELPKVFTLESEEMTNFLYERGIANDLFTQKQIEIEKQLQLFN